MLYLVTHSLAGPARCAQILRSFQRFMENPGPETFEMLAGDLDPNGPVNSDTSASSESALADALGYLYYPLLTMHPDDAERLSLDKLEIALSLTLSVIAGWSDLHPDMTLIHDASSNMSRQKDIWDALVSPQVPADVVGWDRRTMRFPIGVHETQFERSEDWAGLQLADIICGSFADHLNSLLGKSSRDPAYAHELATLVSDWPVTEHNWPEAKFSPEELGTVGPSFTDPLLHAGRIAGEALRKRRNT
jgi:hypothetical protein